jgi:hypothetical protein
MTDLAPLRPATPDEIAQSLAFALRYNGRKRVHDADDVMTRITTERLVRHLEMSGFVIMKAPPGAAPTTAGMPSSVG